MKVFYKKILPIIVNVVFSISMLLLGKFNTIDIPKLSGSTLLYKYQLVVTFFWSSGIIKFVMLNNDTKVFLYKSIESLIIAISAIPLWNYISGERDNLSVIPFSTVFYFVVLMVVLKIVKGSVNLSGKAAIVTHILIPIVIFTLIRLGVSIIGSVVVSIILAECVNYYFYKRTRAK